MNDKINAYVLSVIPKNISKRKKQAIYDELSCHLLDHADFYKELGYTEEQSIDKAIEDMGNDEKIKNYLCDEFEELYHEKTYPAFISSAFVLLLNYLCLPLDTWVSSAGFNAKPTILKVIISFAMIFAVIGIICFARIKRYRKTLIGIGVSNLIIAISVLWSFYPQSAFYAAEHNFLYAIDKLTPFVCDPSDFGYYYYLSWIFIFSCVVYCFVQATKIKRGTVKKTKTPGKIITAFVCSAMVITASSAITYNWSKDFRFPIWFDYKLSSTTESEQLFNNIDLNDDFEKTKNYLNQNGWISITDYEQTLNKNNLKKFKAECKEKLNFDNDYIIFFNPESTDDGNGFIFIKTDDSGFIREKGTGNPEPLKQGKYGFRYFGIHVDDLEYVFVDWKKLRIGDNQEEVMSRFGKQYGEIYSHFLSSECEKFAIYCYNEFEGNKDCSVYIELVFSDNKLLFGKKCVEEWSGHNIISSEDTVE